MPLINTEKATDQVQQVLNDISSRLTTEVLIDLNGRLAGDDRPNPDTVAEEWLTEQGLL